MSCRLAIQKNETIIDKRIQKELNAEYIVEDSLIIEKTIKQFNEYFDKRRRQFSIPLLLIGTEFQKLVWHHLLQIQYGETKTYLELAKQLNNEKAIRAVAAANGANAISIIVPCHRIIGSNGKLVGYAGGLKTKRKLLLLEQSLKQNRLFPEDQ